MSELINTRDSRATIRWKLLTSVSAAALIVSAYTAGEALAADSDRPLIWIELGGQLDQLSDAQQEFSPAFLSAVTRPNLISAFDVQSPPAFGLEEDGKLSFQPQGSDWVFSASIRYGRSGATRHVHHQTPNEKVHVHVTVPPPFTAFRPFFAYYYSMYWYPNGHRKFADGQTDQSENHAILDFEAGKDVGLGMFGTQGTSSIGAGVRIVQFRSKDNVRLQAEPDLQYPSTPVVGNIFTAEPLISAFKSATVDFHDYTGKLIAQRSFRGLGPSVSWDASAAIAGNSQAGELTIDWGINAALLFGRQRSKVHTQTTTYHYNHGTHWHRTNSVGNVNNGLFFGTGTHLVAQPHTTTPADFNRTRSVTVPNLGGFAGISLRYADAKISFGYRADFFFGAMDGGIDTRKEENRAFFGPYASISIGIGD